MQVQSMVSYYQENQFNPVPIALDTASAWESHFQKRRNLYERHLGIPFALLRDRSVLEFGPNSGENALVLASLGARVNLVEPNEQALPRLKQLFRRFNLEKNLAALVHTGIEEFKSEELYDLVLAEGFLYTLPNRNELVRKICGLLRPGGLAVISFIDRYGSLIELTRRLVLWRVCQLAVIDDIGSEACLGLAKQLYGEDFSKLKASRTFAAWWKDNLVSPFLLSSCLWSYQELLPLVEQGDGEFRATSPQWATLDHFAWYKNVPDTQTRHQHLLEAWAKTLPFFLTGISPAEGQAEAASAEVIHALAELIEQISAYTTRLGASIDLVRYPTALEDYFEQSRNKLLIKFNSEMKRLYEALPSNQSQQLISTYHHAETLRGLWGSPYHYLCFSKSLD